MKDKDMLIFNLNKALQMEYSDVFLYPREAKMTEDSAISEVFEEFGLMETRHADILAQQILALGGKPLWDFHLLENKKGIKGIISRHIDYEQRAIDFYASLINEVDEQLRVLLRGIRAEEQVHLSRLKQLSNSLK